MDTSPGKALLNKVLSLLALPTLSTLPPETTAPPAKKAPAKPQSIDTADFENRLGALLSGNNPVVAGRVHLLNLSRIAEHYGPRWPQLSEKVNQLVTLTLSRRLDRRDYFTRVKDGVYVLVFATLPESQARLKCALLADEIAGKLLGQDAHLDALDVRSAVVSVDGRVEMRPISTLDALDSLLQNAESALHPDSAATTDSAAKAEPGWQACGRLIADAEKNLAQWGGGPATAGGADDCNPVAMENLLDLLRQAERALLEQEAHHDQPTASSRKRTAAGPAIATEALRVESLRRNVSRLITVAEAALKQRHAGLIRRIGVDVPLDKAEVVFRYRPLWHVPHQVINAYLCVPGLKSNSDLVLGDALLPAGADPVLVSALDRLVLRKAVEDIHAMTGARRRIVVAVPVHHTTLNNSASRREYMAICQAIQPTLHPFLVWEIVDPIVGFAGSHIPPAVAMLRPYGRAVLLRLDLDHGRFDDLMPLGLHAVGTEIKDLHLGEQETIRRLELFRARAERFSLRTYAYGLKTLSLTTAAVCAGFEYVEGTAVAAPMEYPAGIHSFDLERVYALNYPWLTSGDPVMGATSIPGATP